MGSLHPGIWIDGRIDQINHLNSCGPKVRLIFLILDAEKVGLAPKTLSNEVGDERIGLPDAMKR